MCRLVAARSLSATRVLVFAALTPALLLLAAEGLLRLTEENDAAFAVDAMTPVHFQRLPDPLLRLAGTAYWEVEEGAAHAAGLRIPRAQSATELRILLLGGCAAAGLDLPRTAGPSGVAERLLDAAIEGRRVRIYNLARSGWATAQAYQQLDRVVDRLRPDLVVLMAGNNESLDIANAVHLTGGHTGRVLQSRALRRRSALARALERLRPEPVPRIDEATEAVPSPNRRQIPLPHLVDGYVERRLARNVERIVARARSARAAVALATIAVNDRFSPTGHPMSMLRDSTRALPLCDQYLLARYYGPTPLTATALERAPEPHEEVDLAIVFGDLQRLAGRPDLARETVRANWSGVMEPDVPTPDERVLRSWALALDDPEGAPSRVVAELAEHPMPEPEHSGCRVAQSLYLAGAIPEAREAFLACRLDAWQYRATVGTNAVLGRTAVRLDVPLIDVEAEVRAASEHGVTGPPLFWDYCHYTPEGAVVAGHALAAGILSALNRGERVPPGAEGKAEFVARWSGRRQDPVELEHWVGADFEAVRILRLVDDRGRPAEGTSGLAEVYRANRLASSVGAGSYEAAAAARLGWASARAADPSLGAALDGNELWLQYLLGERPQPPARERLWAPAGKGEVAP